MTISEAMGELKRINSLIEQRNRELRQYSSKRKGSEDTIKNQKTYVNEQFQSAQDLIKRYCAIKLAIQQSNLNTKMMCMEREMSVAEAIIYKQNLSKVLENLYDSLNSQEGDRQVQQFSQSFGRIQMQNVSKEALEALNLSVELLYDPVRLQKLKDQLIDFNANINVQIDKSNHTTYIDV